MQNNNVYKFIVKKYIKMQNKPEIQKYLGSSVGMSLEFPNHYGTQKPTKKLWLNWIDKSIVGENPPKKNP